MKKPKYTATLSGGSWAVGPTAAFATITEARKWAESYGSTADHCRITNGKGETVALHIRDANSNGQRWFKAAL